MNEDNSRNRYMRAIVLMMMSGVVAYSLKHGPQPLIPSIAGELGLMPAEGSLIVAAEMAGMSATLLLVIMFADFLSRKWVMGLSLGAAAILDAVMGAGVGFHVIVACRFLQGMLLGTFPALMIAYINEEFPANRTATTIGLYLGSTAAGGMLGRFVATLLSDMVSWREVFFLFTVCGALVAVLYCSLMPASRHAVARPRMGSLASVFALVKDSRLLLLNFIGFSLMGTFAAVYTYITYALLDAPYFLTKVELAPIFLMQIFGTMSSAVAGKLADHWGKGRVLKLGFALMICGSFMTLGAPLCAKYVGLGLFISGIFACHTTAASWVGQLDGIDKAPAASLYMLCYYIGGSVLSVLGGFFYHHLHWTGLVAMIVLFTVLSIGAFIAFMHKVASSKTNDADDENDENAMIRARKIPVHA
ncbi:MAG: MFS transporter [Selenomonadaceae bacterium]